MGRWIAGLKDDDIPADVRDAARLQLLNLVAAVHSAAMTGEARSVAEALKASSGSGKSTALAQGSKHSAVDAALFNTSHSMAQDYDDIIWMGHTSHSAVFASLAMAEHQGRSARELVTAIVIANEIAGRLGGSSFLGPLNGQMWTFIHLVGAAASTSRLLGLNAEQTTHALAIALAQPPFALQPGFMSPTSKLLAAATPTSIGIRAAHFAQAGMTGALNLLEDQRGFWRRFAFVPLPQMLGGLGEFWALRTLTFKPYPGCHYFQTACEAIEAILQRKGRIDVERIRRVEIDTTKLGVEVTRFASDYAPAEGSVSPVNVNFDLRFTAAILFLEGKLTGREVEPHWLAERSAALRSLAERIQVRHDPALTLRVIASARAVSAGREALSSLGPGDLAKLIARYRAEYSSSLLSWDELAGWVRALVGPAANTPELSGHAIPLAFPSRVRVHFDDGTHEVEQVDLCAGSLASPTMPGVLESKFIREVGASLGQEAARSAWKAGLALESAPISSFVSQVSPAPSSAPGR
jgi:2-methylcitrate dehydratase PrpD